MPKISVILPVYNSEKYISPCLDSVLMQTMEDYELIVVDDGSTDSTPEILAEYATHDPKVIVIRKENSGKPAVARNAGIRRASGTYITFLDSDDLYEPNKLKRESELLDQFDYINLVFSDMYTANQNTVKNKKTYLQDANISSRAQLLGNNTYVCPEAFYNFMTSQCTSVSTLTVMVRKSRLFKESEWFPEDMTIGEDIDLWFRLVKGSEILFIDEPLACNRQHTASITNDPERFLLGSVRVHSNNYVRALHVLTADERKMSKVRIANNLFHLAYHYKQAHKYCEARRTYLDSFAWDFSIKTFFAIIKICIISFFAKKPVEAVSETTETDNCIMKNYSLVKKEKAYLFVTTSDLDNVGGVGQVVSNLLNYIADRKRYEPILLINSWNSKSLQAHSKGPYVKYFYRLRGPYDAKALLKNLILFIFFLPAVLMNLHSFLKANNVRVVNVHYVGLHAISFVILRKLKLFSGKVILSFHGTDAFYLHSISAIESFFYRMLLRSTDHIVACSRNLADVIEKFDANLSRKITVIYNGIDVQKFDGERDIAFAIDEELQTRPFILNIGAFRKVKGQDVLLRAFSRIAYRFPDHYLVMIGAPGDATLLIKKLIEELGLQRRVYLYETVPHERIPAFFDRALVFVLPSRLEGMGIVLLEAGVSSVPVIAANVGGIPEVIEHNVTGLLFETEDVEALAQELTLLLENPALRNRLEAKLKKHVLGKFTWDRAYRKYLSLISTVS